MAMTTVEIDLCTYSVGWSKTVSIAQLCIKGVHTAKSDVGKLGAERAEMR